MFNKIIESGLYLLVFLLPFGTRWIIKTGQLNRGAWEYGTYSFYATDALLIFVLLLFIIQRFLERRISNFEFRISNLIQNLKFKIQNYLIGGLILASAASVFGATDKFLALYKFGWLILGVGLFWLIASADYQRLKLIYALGAGALVSAGLGIWQFLSQASFANKWLGLALHRGADLGTAVIETLGADGVPERWLRAYGSFDHPNILGGFLAMAIILLIGQIVDKERISNFPSFAKAMEDKQFSIFKFLNWLLLLAFTAALFFSFSRSAWLALAAGLIALAALAIARRNLKRQKSLAEIILALAILLLILFSQYQNLIATRFSGAGRLESKSIVERLASDQEAWLIIRNNWFGGVGLGNYGLALNQSLPGQVSYFYQPAHNVFLLVWAETGVFGILFFVGLIILAFVRWPHRPPLNFGGGALRHDSQAAWLIALIVLMGFDHWLFSLHFGGLFFWLVIGIAYRK